MKNYILIVVLLSLSFFISSSQNEKISQEKDNSYILTKEGKKIPFLPGESITQHKNNLFYCASKVLKETKFLKKDIHKNNPIKIYTSTFGEIKTENISKIVNNDALYLPIKDRFTRIYRLIAKNKTHTLGFVNIGDTYYKFLIIDNETNKVLKENIYTNPYLTSKTLECL